MAKQLSQGHERSKAIYIVPLKALAMEKFEDLSEMGRAMGWTVGLGIGDATAEAKNIDDCNILVCTSEKLDSLLRHKAELVSDVCCVVADEFHLMNDATRGPTLGDQPHPFEAHQARCPIDCVVGYRRKR